MLAQKCRGQLWVESVGDKTRAKASTPTSHVPRRTLALSGNAIRSTAKQRRCKHDGVVVLTSPGDRRRSGIPRRPGALREQQRRKTRVAPQPARSSTARPAPGAHPDDGGAMVARGRIPPCRHRPPSSPCRGSANGRQWLRGDGGSPARQSFRRQSSSAYSARGNAARSASAAAHTTMNEVVEFVRRAWSWLKIRVLWLVDFLSCEERVCEKDVEGGELLFGSSFPSLLRLTPIV